MLTRGVAQVVKSNITGYKRVKAGDPFSQQLGHWDVAVAVHSSTSENTLREASVSLLPERTSAGRLDIRLFDPPIVSTVTEASHAVTAWRHTKVKADFAPMFLPGFPDYLRDTAGQLVSEMARMGAIAGNSRDSALYLSHAEDGVRSKLDAIERLETAGLVDRCFCSEDQSAWLLNLEALQHCTLRLSLDSPRPLFTEPAGLPALTWSRMECLCFLHKHSWDWKFLHDKDEKGSVLPINLAFRVSDDKVIYIFRGVLRQRYLCCLAHVEAGVPLPGGDDVDTICHFESDGYYGQLLGLDVLRKQQQEALMDGPAVPPEAFQRPQDSVEDEILPGPPEAMQPQPGDGLQQKQRMRHHMREDDTDELDDWILSELEKQLNDDPPHPNDSEDEQNDADDAHADSGPADDDDAVAWSVLTVRHFLLFACFLFMLPLSLLSFPGCRTWVVRWVVVSVMFPGRMTMPSWRIWDLPTTSRRGPAAKLMLVRVRVAQAAQAQIRAPAQAAALLQSRARALVQLRTLRLMLLRTQPRTSHIPNVCAGMRLSSGKISASHIGRKLPADKLVTWFCADFILGCTTALGAPGVLPGMTRRSVTWCFAG